MKLVDLDHHWPTIGAKEALQSAAFVILLMDRAGSLKMSHSVLQLTGRPMSQPPQRKKCIACLLKPLAALGLSFLGRYVWIRQFSLRSGPYLPCLRVTGQTWSTQRIRSYAETGRSLPLSPPVKKVLVFNFYSAVLAIISL